MFYLLQNISKNEYNKIDVFGRKFDPNTLPFLLTIA